MWYSAIIQGFAEQQLLYSDFFMFPVHVHPSIYSKMLGFKFALIVAVVKLQ